MDGQRRNLILIPVIIAISAAIVWSLYNLMERPGAVPSAAVVATSTEGHIKLLYEERLKMEGERTGRVEQLIGRSALSDKRASYFKTAEGEPK